MYMDVYMCVYTHIHINMHVHVYVYIYVYVCICVCIVAHARFLHCEVPIFHMFHLLEERVSTYII